MRKSMMVAALAAVTVLAACQKTGEGEYQVKTPDVDVNSKTTTVETPSVDVRPETSMVITPRVDVTTPGDRKPPATKRP